VRPAPSPDGSPAAGRAGEALSGRAALLLAMLLWGLSQVANRVLVLEVGPRELFLLRFNVAALAVVALLPLLRRGPSLRRSDATTLVLGAMLMSVAYQPLVAFGTARVTASVSSLLLGTEPVFIALFAALFLRDRPPGTLWAGLLLSLLGMAILTGVHGADGRSTDPVGALLVLGASVSFSLYSVLSKPLTHRYRPLQLTAWSTLIGTAALWPFAWLPAPLAWRPPDALGWAAAALLGAGCSVASIICWNHGLRRVGAAAAGMYLYTVPVFGVLAGAVLLHERVGLPTLLAGALIVAGVAVGARGGTRRA
jgi:drug/metabolite transporter (DMT)-like permease